MLELNRSYTKPEMTRILGTKSRQGIDRKLQRYGVGFVVCGRGENAVYTINTMSDPFKVYAVLHLDCDANTDFRKLRNFYYYYFNDEEFMAMPDEVKEFRMCADGKNISRCTIAKYVQKLEQKNLISRNTDNFIYYFAYKDSQRRTDRDEYRQAWIEYWENIADGFGSYDAIIRMRAKCGGVARKQAIPAINGIYNQEIEYMLTLIHQSIENEIGG